MGNDSDKEHLLVLLRGKEPKHLTDSIRKRFPRVEVSFFSLSLVDGIELGNDGLKVPEELLRTATILATFNGLPDKPESVPNLKLIHIFSAGVDHISSNPMYTSTEIPITTSSGIHGVPIAEWVLMNTLAASHMFTTTYEWQKQHHWGSIDKHFSLSDWHGKTVGVAGYGSIGRQIARVFSALGAHIHAYTATPRTTRSSRAEHNAYHIPNSGDPSGVLPRAWYSGTSRDSLHTFLRSGLNLLVISLPLTPATTHLFSTEEFEILSLSKPPCYLVNISRGAILNQSALVNALNQGILSGAALDVADPEPLPAGSELWDARNCSVSPHVSAVGKDYMSRTFDVLATNVERLEKGADFVNLVRRGRGY